VFPARFTRVTETSELLQQLGHESGGLVLEPELLLVELEELLSVVEILSFDMPLFGLLSIIGRSDVVTVGDLPLRLVFATSKKERLLTTGPS